MRCKIAENPGKLGGFTLIEIITVMFIIAVIASIMIPNMRKTFYRAQLSGCQSNLRNLATLVQLYATDKKRYPANLQELVPDYIANIPTCPSAGVETYTTGYEQQTEPDRYTLHCKESFHTTVGLAPDEPWFNPERGLGP